ncbi:MAG: hypothetical protein ACKOXK_03275 [Chakrabartia sp.]
MRTLAKTGLIMFAASTLGACAEYRDNDTLRSAGRAAAIGAAGGAAVGAVVGGVNPVEGAVAGGLAGGAIGAVTAKDRKWLRDDQGYCYYVNSDGQRVYDRSKSC